MKILFALGILLCCYGCKKEITTTAWNPSPKQLAKWEKPWINEQIKRAKKDPRLTFIQNNYMVGTNLVYNSEFNEFLNSFEAIFGKDSLYHLGFDSLQIISIKNPNFRDSLAINISLKQANLFLSWKSKKAEFELLVKEGIVKNTEPLAVGSDNYPPSTFEKYLKEETSMLVNDKTYSCCGCGPYLKVRIYDDLPMPKYELMDCSDYQFVNSILKKPILKSDCELNKSDTLKKNNCGFRYKIVPHQRPTNWD